MATSLQSSNLCLLLHKTLSLSFLSLLRPLHRNCSPLHSHHPFLVPGTEQDPSKCLLKERMSPHLLPFFLHLSSSPFGIFHLLFQISQLLHGHPMLNRSPRNPQVPNETAFSCFPCTSPNIWVCLVFPVLALPFVTILLEALSLKNKPTSPVPPKEAFTFANSIDLILEAAGSGSRSLINMTTPSEARTSRSLGQDLLLLGSALTLPESLTMMEKDLQSGKGCLQLLRDPA